MAIVDVGGDVKVFNLFILCKFLADTHRNSLVIVLVTQTALVNRRLVNIRNTPRHQDAKN
jgi:hypothetical protein